MAKDALTLIRSYSTNFFRRRRANQFRKLFPSGSYFTIVDLGGRPSTWDRIKPNAKITLFNLEDNYRSDRYNLVVGDATRTGLPNQSFDIAYSNSTIEHVGDIEDQTRMASEMRRIGKRVYCQTPCLWFFIEPHFFAPFVHWFPQFWTGRILVRYFSLAGYIKKHHDVDGMRAHIRYLSKREMKSIFPDCKIHTERFLGWPKSFIAVR